MESLMMNVLPPKGNRQLLIRKQREDRRFPPNFGNVKPQGGRVLTNTHMERPTDTDTIIKPRCISKNTHKSTHPQCTLKLTEFCFGMRAE